MFGVLGYRLSPWALVVSKVGAFSSSKSSPIDGMEPDFRSIKGDWNMLSMKSHHILNTKNYKALECLRHPAPCILQDNILIIYFDQHGTGIKICISTAFALLLHLSRSSRFKSKHLHETDSMTITGFIEGFENTPLHCVIPLYNLCLNSHDKATCG